MITIPAPQSTDAAKPASDVVNLADEAAAYIATVKRRGIEESEREALRDVPAVRVGRYCIVPPRAA